MYSHTQHIYPCRVLTFSALLQGTVRALLQGTFSALLQCTFSALLQGLFDVYFYISICPEPFFARLHYCDLLHISLCRPFWNVLMMHPSTEHCVCSSHLNKLHCPSHNTFPVWYIYIYHIVCVISKALYFSIHIRLWLLSKKLGFCTLLLDPSKWHCVCALL